MLHEHTTPYASKKMFQVIGELGSNGLTSVYHCYYYWPYLSGMISTVKYPCSALLMKYSDKSNWLTEGKICIA